MAMAAGYSATSVPGYTASHPTVQQSSYEKLAGVVSLSYKTLLS
jgi:hypothetical protein